MKHALLDWMVCALQRKPRAIFVLDTHAGAGRTRLDGEQASRTGEWLSGIGRLLAGQPAAALADYLDLVRRAGEGFYPGSPLLVSMRLRPQDTLACCELHPEEHAKLRRLFLGNPAVGIHARDGWDAIGALLPPREARRGLVLIDPPFEQPDELPRLAGAIQLARRRFPSTCVAAWYPIKHRAPVRAFHDRLAELAEPDLVCAELTLRPPLDAARLNGSGLIVANPPWGFDAAAQAILDAIAERCGEAQSRGTVHRLTEEAGAR